MSDRPTRSSGLANKVWISTRNRPIRIGICTTSGPRQPRGLTPASLYIFMVSCETRARSPLKRSCISFILGWSRFIERIWRTCFKVKGKVISRTKIVNTMMAIPMLLKKTTYNTISVLSMGRMIISFQREKIISKKLLPSGGRYYLLACRILFGVKTPDLDQA